MNLKKSLGVKKPGTQGFIFYLAMIQNQESLLYILVKRKISKNELKRIYQKISGIKLSILLVKMKILQKRIFDTWKVSLSSKPAKPIEQL